MAPEIEHRQFVRQTDVAFVFDRRCRWRYDNQLQIALPRSIA
jgi:hypothetical protein